MSKGSIEPVDYGNNRGAVPINVPRAEISTLAVAPTAPPPNSLGLVPGQNVTVIIAHPPVEKSLFEAYLLCVPLGLLGLHQFYLRRYGFGVFYFLTLGGCGIGWLVDIFRMPTLVKETNRKIQHPEEDVGSVSLCDAYITWFPLGILGGHQYYLRRYNWGVAYTFTLGFFTIGWIVDAFRLPSLVRATNRRLALERTNTLPCQASLCDAYALGVTPAGLFGAHHFYLRRPAFGVFYLCTLGGCGVGWIVDWFRMKWLVERANNPEQTPLGKRHKYLDDSYVLAFPLGILGLHHFYLERTVWGFVYLSTLGLFGIGWLIDLFRMPCLVNDANKRIEEELRIMAEIRQQLGVPPSTVLRREIFYQPMPIGTVYPVYPGPSNQNPSLQPPSYETTMATSSSLAAPSYESAAVGGAAAPFGRTNEAFQKDKF